MNGTQRTKGALATVGLAVLALALAPALIAPASAAPVPPAATAAPQQWAYGAQRWINNSVDLPNAVYDQSAFFGWQVVVTATNTSATSQAWEVQRTMAGRFSAEYCQPNCSAPTTSATLNVSGWESDTGFANITATTVDSNGSAVAALGLANASFDNAANLSESLAFSGGPGPFNGTSAGHFFVGGTAVGQVSFAPALGLVPTNLTTGASWNASSVATSAGAWSVGYALGHTGPPSGPAASSGNASGTLNFTGPVGIAGADVGTITLANNATVPQVVLTWTGPFDVMDGVVLVPHAFDLFGDGGHAWEGLQYGNEMVATSHLDLRVGPHGRLALVAASASYGPQDPTLEGAPGSDGPTPPPGTGDHPGPAATTSGPTVVQAQPEPVPAAQRNAACLVGSCLATSSGSPAVFGWLVGFLVVGAATAAVLGLVGLRGRRRGPGASPSQLPTDVPPPGARGVGLPPPPP